MYAVASRTLARVYTHEELVASGPSNFSSACEAGTRHDFECSPYSGTIQTWTNCYEDTKSNAATLAVTPSGGECVVLLQMIV